MTKVVKYYQDNCTPCKMLDQMLQGMELSVDEAVKLSDENRERLKNELNIMSTPTMIAYDDAGNEITRVSGVGFSKINAFFKEVEEA